MIPPTKNCYSLSPIKILTLLLCLCLLVGCSTTNTPQTTTLQIGIAVYQQDDTFISSIVQNMEKLAREQEADQNIRINLSIVDGRSNQTVQLEQIDRLISSSCDVICVNIVDRTAAAVLIDKAEAANIPLIFFNRQPVEEDMNRWEHAYYVGALGEESGHLQGEIVRDIWNADSSLVDLSGDGTIQYLMLEGEPSHQDTLLRTRYSLTPLATTGISVEKLASGIANWNRSEANILMSQWLTEITQPIEVIFANNDDMALGAIDAYLAAGLTAQDMPIIVGVDATTAALAAIEAGQLTGTVLNDSEGMAQAMMALSTALSLGTAPAQAVELTDDHYVWLAYSKITADTLGAE